MKGFLRYFFILLACTISFSSCKTLHSPTVGQTASDFSYVTIDGLKHTLSEHKGRKLLLVFWSTWCEVCKNEIPDLNEVSELLKNSTATDMIGVIVLDQRDRAFEFLKLNPLHFINGVGDSKPISDAYKVEGVPEFFFLDEQGRFLPIINTQGESVVKLIGEQPWGSSNFMKQFQ